MSGGHHVDPNDPFQKRVAVALAVYTVILALSNMLNTQAESNAILTSNKTTSQWNYFQAKGNKQNLAQVELELIGRLPPPPQGNGELTTKLQADIERYEKEKAEIKKKAEDLQDASDAFVHRGHRFEYAATIVEFGIILGGIALLMHSKKLLYTSAALATVSAGLLAFTFFSH
jgi:hypothetical protein